MVPLFRNGFMDVKGGGMDETNVLHVVREALQKRKTQKADEIAFSHFAMSYADLLATGKERLPDSEFRNTIAEIRSCKMRAEFVLAGFCGGFPYIIETRQDFTTSIREDFASVGAGSYLAQSVMLHRQHSDVEPLDRTLYIVWEAKKVAEREISVGSYTTVVVVDENGAESMVSRAGKKWLDAEFKELGPRDLKKFALPEDALDLSKS
jgi:20S proteasome alpha/beta subunit